MQELEDRKKEEEAKGNNNNKEVEEEKEEDVQKLDPEDPEKRSIFIQNLSTKLTEDDIYKLCEGMIYRINHLLSRIWKD